MPIFPGIPGARVGSVAFVYGPLLGDIFSPRWPVVGWVPRETAVGGRLISVGGIPASYRVRLDPVLDLTLRVEEDEWLDLLDFVAWGQTGAGFTFVWDASEVVPDEEPALLDSPEIGSALTLSRNSEYPRLMEVTVGLRGNGTPLPWRGFF